MPYTDSDTRDPPPENAAGWAPLRQALSAPACTSPEGVVTIPEVAHAWMGPLPQGSHCRRAAARCGAVGTVSGAVAPPESLPRAPAS